MSGYRYALAPFLTPTILSFTSQHAAYPAVNVLDDDSPSLAWRTLDTTTSSVELDFGVNVLVDAVLINRANFPNVVLRKRVQGGTNELATPNLLQWNERLATADGAPTAPWGRFNGFVTVTLGPTGGGPYPRVVGQRLDFLSSSSSGIHQDVNIGGIADALNGRAFAGHAWLRSDTAGTAKIQLIPLATAGISTTTVNVGTQWSRVPFFLTMATGALMGNSVRFRLWRDVGDLSLLYFGGAQMTLDALAPLPFDYWTQDAGMVIPRDRRTGRRKVLAALAFGVRILTVEIPGPQITDDVGIGGGTAYELGGLTMTALLKTFPGEFSWPFSIQVDSFGSSQVNTAGVRRMRSAREPRATLQVSGTNISSSTEAVMWTILQQGRHQPFLFCEGQREGGGLPGTNDPSLAYFVRHKVDPQFRYEIPEVYSMSLTLEEVT